MKNLITEIKWGLVFTLVIMLWVGLERAVGLHDTHIDKHLYLTNLFAIPAILVYVLALRDKKINDLNGVMSFRQGFVSGAIVTLVVTALSPLTQWITSTFITPHYFDNVIAYSVQSGFHDSLEEAQAYFNLKSYMIQSAIGAMLMGLITTTVVAFFMRTRSAASPVGS